MLNLELYRNCHNVLSSKVGSVNQTRKVTLYCGRVDYDIV